MMKAWSRPRTDVSTPRSGGESRSGMHNPLVLGSNPSGPTIIQKREHVQRERGLAQEKLAELAEPAPRTIRKFEAVRLYVLVTTLRRLRTAIGCRYDDLFGL